MPAPINIPDKLETGTQNHEAITAIPAVVEFLSGFGSGDSLREKLITSFEAIEVYENSLADKIRSELGKIEGITIYQAAGRKPPTIGFTLKNTAPAKVCKWMCDYHSIFVADGDFYATTMADKLNLNQNGGFIRVGLAPYNTAEEVDVFIKAMHDMVQHMKKRTINGAGRIVTHPAPLYLQSHCVKF